MVACASPPCGDFSTIKLRPGPGPRSIRACEYPLGIPDATASQYARIRSSLCLPERAASLLLAVFQAGGHVILEQPPNALSWRQVMGQHHLLEVSASCCCVAACAYGFTILSAGCLPLPLRSQYFGMFLRAGPVGTHSCCWPAVGRWHLS